MARDDSPLLPALLVTMMPIGTAFVILASAPGQDVVQPWPLLLLLGAGLVVLAFFFPARGTGREPRETAQRSSSGMPECPPLLRLPERWGMEAPRRVCGTQETGVL